MMMSFDVYLYNNHKEPSMSWVGYGNNFGECYENAKHESTRALSKCGYNGPILLAKQGMK